MAYLYRNFLVILTVIAVVSPLGASAQPSANSKLDTEVADAISESTGISAKKSLEPKKAPAMPKNVESSAFGINPLKWFYGPITQMQETIVKLEQQIMRLE